MSKSIRLRYKVIGPMVQNHRIKGAKQWSKASGPKVQNNVTRVQNN